MTAAVRLGVLGCGRVFERFHLPALDRVPGLELAAACDTDPARLEWAHQRVKPPRLYDSTAALAGAEGLDAVLVLTPPAGHAAAVTQCLRAGLHVLVEKPMALTPSEGREMLEVAQQAGRMLRVGFTRRFREPYQQLRRQLVSHGERVVGGAFELSFSTAEWQARSNFLGDDRQGGGIIEDVLSHQVDLLSWLIRAPDAVRAEVGTGTTLRVEIRIGDANMICQASHGPYREHLRIDLDDGQSLQATGSRMWVGQRQESAWQRRGAWVGDRLGLARDRLLRRPNVTLTSFERQLRDFQDALRGMDSIGASGTDGLRAVEIAAACRTSIAAGASWQRVNPIG
jgi:predicted dehydrogenase